MRKPRGFILETIAVIIIFNIFKGAFEFILGIGGWLLGINFMDTDD